MKVKKVYLLFSLIIIITLLSWISSCKHAADISGLPEVCFEGEVLPIFKNSCALTACHDGTGESDLVLNNYEGIMEGIKSGDPADSEIYEAITNSGDDRMPPDQPLSTDNRTLIMVWIEQGAEQTTCPGK